MKSLISPLVLLIVITSCNFSKGTEKKFDTGFSISYNGFRVGAFGLVMNDAEIKTNKVEMGQVVNIEVDGIEGYQEKEGRVFPGLDLRVTDKDGNVVLDGADILKKDNGYAPSEATVLSGTITVGEPMKSGQTYHAKMRIWDKLKEESEIIVEGDLVVK